MGLEQPTAVPGLSGATAVAAGYIHSLALVGGTVYGWGDNSIGQVGAGTGKAIAQPVPVAVLTANGSALSGATGLAAGAGHSLALLSGGTVDAWGSDYYGSLGDGASLPGGNVPYAQPVPLLSGATAIAAGYAHSVALATVTGTQRTKISTVHFSSAAYNLAANTISLTFTGALNPTWADDVMNYRVTENGRPDQVVAASLQASGTTVILRLNLSLVRGTRLGVAWANLQDAAGLPLPAGSQTITVH